jgi:hypothetical protein
MRLRTRRAGEEQAPAGPGSDLPVLRAERAMLTLAVHAQQLDLRVSRLEQRVDESDSQSLELPSLDDVLDVRVHSARLAAELSRVTVELRAEIDQLTAALARTGDQAPLHHADRARALTDEIIDLSDGFDQPERRWHPPEEEVGPEVD